ncbi:MAG: hypothetical protein KBT28_02480 [Bacteroidales bacterium]|nr:hypothetical protein [Candidatus Colimorpha merdihippi]
MGIFVKKVEQNGLLLAYKHTKCDNLLLLTNHLHEEVIKDGLHIMVKPVYEWCKYQSYLNL